jgi:hypothetical protein
MSDSENSPGTASARLPRPGEQPPPGERPEGAEALPAAQEQPPSFMYGSAAAGTARETVQPAGDQPEDGQPGE